MCWIAGDGLYAREVWGSVCRYDLERCYRFTKMIFMAGPMLFPLDDDCRHQVDGVYDPCMQHLLV